MLKRGQISSVFIYIFAVIVIGFILIFGYRYITDVNKTIKDTDLIFFQKQITSDIKAISSDFGSTKKVSYSSPADLCLFDLDKKDNILDNLPIDFNPLIKDSVNSDVKKNAFLVSNKIFESFYVGDLEIDEPFYQCLTPVAGKISFTIEGAGNKALISTPS